jgi:hypothetical protein
MHGCFRMYVKSTWHPREADGNLVRLIVHASDENSRLPRAWEKRIHVKLPPLIAQTRTSHVALLLFGAVAFNCRLGPMSLDLNGRIAQGIHSGVPRALRVHIMYLHSRAKRPSRLDEAYYQASTHQGKRL